MQVTVQVSIDVARGLHQRGPRTTDSEVLLGMMETIGLTLQPMHPDTDDPNLQRYFTGAVPDRATAQRVIDSLQQVAAIEAAYVKPIDELP